MNVILLVCDTWRRDHSGIYGNNWIHTPNINAFAARSAVFENAYFGSYPTLPCRRDIATGKLEFPWRGWGGLERDDATLPGLLGAAGKTSYFITDVYHHWGRDAGTYWKDFSGFDLVRGQERDGYMTDTDVQFDVRPLDYPPHNRLEEPHFRNSQVIRKQEQDWFSPQVFSRAARWLQHNRDRRDFFLMVDAFDPHEPWDPPRYYVDMYDDARGVKEYPVSPYGPVDKNLSPAELKRVKALYAAEITMVDRWLGMLFSQIHALGLMDNTMIVLTTDHGTHNGDHGRTGKNFVLWEEICHIPLIVWHPRLGNGARPAQFAQPMDLFPTILEAVGIEPPAWTHGRSLLPYLENPEAPDARDAILFGEFKFSCNLTDKEYTLYQGVDPSNPPLYSYSQIVSKWASKDWGPFDGVRRLVGPNNADTGDSPRSETRLYHLPSDPKQENNIAAREPATLKRLQKRMIEKLEEIDAPKELMRRWMLDRI